MHYIWKNSRSDNFRSNYSWLLKCLLYFIWPILRLGQKSLKIFRLLLGIFEAKKIVSDIIWPLATNVCSHLLYWQAISFQYAITTILQITLYLTVSTLFTDSYYCFVLTMCKFCNKSNNNNLFLYPQFSTHFFTLKWVCYKS